MNLFVNINCREGVDKHFQKCKTTSSNTERGQL